MVEALWRAALLDGPGCLASSVQACSRHRRCCATSPAVVAQEENGEKLEAFHAAVNSNDNSHLVSRLWQQLQSVGVA